MSLLARWCLCGFLLHRPYLAVREELWEEEDAADMDGDGRNEIVAASGMGSVFLLSRTMEYGICEERFCCCFR